MLQNLKSKAVSLGKRAVEIAESEAAQTRLRQMGDLAGKAGSASVSVGKRGAALTASTAQRTYHGLAGFGEARGIVQDAQQRYAVATADFQTHGHAVQQRLEAFERTQQLLLATTVARFVELYLRHKDKIANSEVDVHVTLNLTPRDVAAFEAAQISAIELAGGLGTAALAGAGAGTAATMAATALGSASTGAALSSLSGAAAHSALLAWFGGGSLAAGGGGMALGAAVLGGIVAAPALLVGTMVAAQQGEQRMTQAQAYAAEVDRALAELALRVEGFTAVIRRTDEVQDVTERLGALLMTQVRQGEALEREGGVDGPHRERFVRAIYQAAVTCKSLKDVMKVPIVDEHLAVTDGSGMMVGIMRQTLDGHA